MEVCVIGTDINPIPTDVAWSGIESLVTYQVKGFVELGLDVTLVSAAGSKWKDWDKIHLIEIPLTRENEKSFFDGYKDKIKDFSCVIDHSNGKRARLANSHVINVSHWLQAPYDMDYKNVVCISKAHAAWTKSQYPPGMYRSPEVVVNGMDPSLFPYQEKKGDEFLFFSVLGPYKGADTVMDLAHKFPNYKFGFGGRNTDYTDVVKKEAAEHPNIRFYGEVGHEEKKKIMGNAKALLQLPKRFNPQEKFFFMDILPMTIIESNLCGTPVIGLAEGGVPEMIENGINGFVCSNLNEVADAMGRIDTISPKKCREYAEGRFSFIRMAKDYINLIERVQRGESW